MCPGRSEFLRRVARVLTVSVSLTFACTHPLKPSSPMVISLSVKPVLLTRRYLPHTDVQFSVTHNRRLKVV